jgi:GTP cyclohydrolase II
VVLDASLPSATKIFKKLLSFVRLSFVTLHVTRERSASRLTFSHARREKLMSHAGEAVFTNEIRSGARPRLSGVAIRDEFALNSAYGQLHVFSFNNLADRKEHIAFVAGSLDALSGPTPPLVRIHSECLTGDLLGSEHCDCGSQLTDALQRCRAEGRGVVVYMRDEGRGIGLYAKLRTYKLQAMGLNTFEANEALGYSADSRDFTIAADILTALGISSARLLTNNPMKVAALEACGIAVERVATCIHLTEHNRRYLEAKREIAKHSIHIEPELEVK